MEASTPDVWRKCSSCKKALGYGIEYFVCSVSTCNGQRTGYVFCSMNCFERHLPGARHRDAGAIRKTSPSSAAPADGPASAGSRPPQRILARPGGTTTPTATSSAVPREVLIVASRLKDYVAARSEFNTSAAVMDVLSDYVRILCDRAIDNARADGRKTVLDRDFDFLRELK
jgi:hypothetical protein